MSAGGLCARSLSSSLHVLPTDCCLSERWAQLLRRGRYSKFDGASSFGRRNCKSTPHLPGLNAQRAADGRLPFLACRLPQA